MSDSKVGLGPVLSTLSNGTQRQSEVAQQSSGSTCDRIAQLNERLAELKASRAAMLNGGGYLSGVALRTLDRKIGEVELELLKLTRPDAPPIVDVFGGLPNVVAREAELARLRKEQDALVAKLKGLLEGSRSSLEEQAQLQIRLSGIDP